MLTCVTRSMNDEMYNMMLSLCPGDWEFHRVKKSSAFGYIDYILNGEFKTKWVLNLDEDCFLIDYTRIYELIEFMEKGNYDYCGVQDGGSIPVRIHNPLVSNPFFNLFNLEKISPLEKDYYDKNYSVEEMKEKYSDKIRFLQSTYKFDNFEPFYSEFFWMLEKGLNPFFNKAGEFRRERYLVIAPLLRVIPYYNNPTMIYDHLEREIALHTWHSRYITFPNIRKHIVNCFNYSVHNSKSTPGKNHVVKTISLDR